MSYPTTEIEMRKEYSEGSASFISFLEKKGQRQKVPNNSASFFVW